MHMCVSISNSGRLATLRPHRVARPALLARVDLGARIALTALAPMVASGGRGLTKSQRDEVTQVLNDKVASFVHEVDAILGKLPDRDMLRHISAILTCQRYGSEGRTSAGDILLQSMMRGMR